MARFFLAAVAALLVVACAGSDSGRAAPAVTADPSPVVVTSTSTVSTTLVFGEVESPGRPLDEVIEQTPGPDGWPLPAGRWTTTAFSETAALDAATFETVTFETSVDLTLRSISNQLITFMNPAEPDFRTVIVLTTSVAFPGDAGTQRPSPRSAASLRETLEHHPLITLTGEGLAGAAGASSEAQWWDLIVESPVQTYPCWFGLGCIEVGVTSVGDQVSALVDTPIRVYFVDEDNPRFRVFVMGESGGFAGLTKIADHVAGHLSFNDEAAPERPAAITALRTVGDVEGGLPAGRYRTMVGASLVDIDLPVALPEVQLSTAGEETLVFLSATGFVAIYDPSKLVSPNADQGRLASRQLELNDLIDGRPETGDDVRAWLSGLYEVTDSGEMEIAGAVAPWWTTGRPLVGGECPPEAPPEALTCTKHAFSDQVFHWTVEDEGPSVGRTLWLQPGLIATVATADGTLSEFQALFDAMTITSP